jgi:Tfp pilus assembly protein PilV
MMSFRAVQKRTGFTLIEVLAILVIIGVGLFSVIALVSYGTRKAGITQVQAIAMATAVSVAYDPTPRLDPVIAVDWIYTPYDINASGNVTSTARGNINGTFVERIETSTDADVIARTAGGQVQARSARVDVTVWETYKGDELASFVTRIVRQAETP